MTLSYDSELIIFFLFYGQELCVEILWQERIERSIQKRSLHTLIHPKPIYSETKCSLIIFNISITNSNESEINFINNIFEIEEKYYLKAWKKFATLEEFHVSKHRKSEERFQQYWKYFCRGMPCQHPTPKPDI